LEVAQAGTADGTPVDIWADHLGGNQRWIIARTADGYWTLSPGFETGKALEVRGGSNQNGAVIDVSTCTGSDAQKWVLLQVQP
ncbi:MAG TPA: RICIN domain-containing protein, partial [Chthoniobacterales bacterium]